MRTESRIALICLSLAFSLMVAFVVWYEAIGFYRIEVEKKYREDGFQLYYRVWNNGEIIASDIEYGIAMEKIDSVEQAKRQWCEDVIKILKK